ncbi:MAG: Holliday junction resolvase RuvX [Candidatus Wallbacteria bacterium]|nr:Holliday junction resolvase RuvX [Candidatus Wallbacteria bacterium]
MRVMGLDYGEVRVGVAMSDPMQIIASPFAVLKNDEQLFQGLEKIIKEQDVGIIVVGWPTNSKDEPTKQTKKIFDFIKVLSQFGLPVERVDEDFTTMDAEHFMLEAEFARKKRKQNKDKIAASLILQFYLNSRI